MAQSFPRLLALTLVAFFALLCLHEAIKGHAITDKNESHNDMAAIFSPLTKLWSGMISPLGKPRHQWARRALWKDYRNSGGSVHHCARSEFDVSTDFRADRHEHKMVDTPVIRAKGTPPSPPGNPGHTPVLEGMETDSVIRSKGTPPPPAGNPSHNPVLEGMETDCSQRGSPPRPGAHDLRVAASILKE